MHFKALIVFLFISVASMAQSPAARLFVLGKVETISSSILGEQRTLNIYLPEGYSASDTVHYPVVYLLDGAAEEDFIHVTGLYQFYSFPWVKQVPPSIVVGIANTDRKRDFTLASAVKEEKERYPTAGHSDKFSAFLQQELQPFIKKHYQASGDQTLIGESLGGLLAAEILLEHPALFNRYIIVSPSLWWNDGSLIKSTGNQLVKNHLPGTQVYIGVGKEGLGPSTIPHVMEVDANLFYDKLMSYKIPGMQIHFDYLPDHNHATIAHQAIMNALKWVY